MIEVPMTESISLARTETAVQSRVSEQRYSQTHVYYRPELDALRFLACVLVFAHHLPLPGRSYFNTVRQSGAFGLPIFFCLSAYLIITLLLKEKDQTGTVQLRWFAIRRMLRIWPLYFFILAVGWVLGRIWPGIHFSVKEIAMFAVMLGNVWMLRYGWVGGPSQVVWSISVEEQFYLGVPLLVRAGGRRAIAICCFVALVLAYIALVRVHLRGEDPGIAAWANSFVQFQFFAAGGLLALMYGRWKVRIALWMRLVVFGASLLAFWIAAPISTSYSGVSLVASYFLQLIGTCGIMVAALYFPVSPPPLFVYLGRISYGIYVFHATVLWFVFGSAFPRFQSYMLFHRYEGTLLAILLSILCASLSYRYIEAPILQLKDRFAIIRSSPRRTA
jgi:peptidoglycan/LPS O-acetylase OafA/YrhL